MKTGKIILTPTQHQHVYGVFLILPFETRNLGILDQGGEGTFTTKRNSSQLFRKLNALGLNHDLLTNEEIKFNWIVIDYFDKETNLFRKLVTSRIYFLTHGQCYEFTGKGFELQCLLPLPLFGINKAREFEKHIGKQERLFEEVA